jgi:hypothetical protein
MSINSLHILRFLLQLLLFSRLTFRTLLVWLKRHTFKEIIQLHFGVIVTKRVFELSPVRVERLLCPFILNCDFK